MNRQLSDTQKETKRLYKANRIAYEALKRAVSFNGGDIASYKDICSAGHYVAKKEAGYITPVMIIQVVLYMLIVILTVSALV